MNSKPSQRFPELQVVELFDDEMDRDVKYTTLQTCCEWSDPYESSVLFYLKKNTWELFSQTPRAIFWLLEGSKEAAE